MLLRWSVTEVAAPAPCRCVPTIVAWKHVAICCVSLISLIAIRLNFHIEFLRYLVVSSALAFLFAYGNGQNPVVMSFCALMAPSFPSLPGTPFGRRTCAATGAW